MPYQLSLIDRRNKAMWKRQLIEDFRRGILLTIGSTPTRRPPVEAIESDHSYSTALAAAIFRNFPANSVVHI